MIVIGITGGIASGKSVASNVCKKYNAYIFDADKEAKNILKIESGSYQYYNESNFSLILITSPESVRIERALARGNLSLDTIQDRIKLQWPDEKKKEYADYIIENNSSLAKFESEIEKLIQKIINDTKS